MTVTKRLIDIGPPLPASAAERIPACGRGAVLCTGWSHDFKAFYRH